MTSRRIILGDCRQVLKEIQGQLDDAIFVSDPPFNVGYHYESYDDRLSDEEYSQLLKEVFGGRPHVMIHYPESLYRHAITLRESPTRVVSWVYNTNLSRQHWYIAFFGVTPDFRKVGQDYKNPNDKNVSSEKTEHPCQMPLEVMKRIIGILPESRLIVDPFLGSGTTALACEMLDRDFIGIEIDPKYVAISKERLTQST